MKKIMSDEKLKTLCYQKAQLIYDTELPTEVLNRLQYELDVIGKEGGSDYLLFLQELVNTAQKELGALIGPGHTSIVGSLVAYCLGITKIDPLKYDLLFERFICPNRFAFPEVWIDVDKEGYASILHNSSTELDKYGQSQNKFFEYLAAGRPVLMTYSVGHSICKENNCGFEIDEQSPESIADAIEHIVQLKDDEYQIYSHNAEETAKRYDFKDLTKKLVSIIESL